MDVKEMLERIENSSYDDVKKMKAEVGEKTGYSKNAKGEITFIVTTRKDFDEVNRRLAETKLLLEFKREKQNKQERIKDSEATHLANRNYYNIENFIRKTETYEEKKKRWKTQRKIREVQKQCERKKEKEQKRRSKEGKRKIKNRIIAGLLIGIAVTSAAQGASAIHTDAKQYNETSKLVEGMDVDQIYDKAEDELKVRIAKWLGISKDDVHLIYEQIDSSMEITKIIAGDKELIFHTDPKGYDSGDYSKKISKTIKDIQERKDDIRSSINTLSAAINVKLPSEDKNKSIEDER